MKEYNIRFAYHRPDIAPELNFMHDELRPLTVAYQKIATKDTDDVIAVDCAIAICNPGDNFEKAVGREISTARLKKGPEFNPYYFTITNEKMYQLVLVNCPQVFSTINENFKPDLLNFMKHSAISQFAIWEAMRYIKQQEL